ncbi:MAG: GNAT family N-acetyltransferase [Bacteroidia bacterium]
MSIQLKQLAHASVGYALSIALRDRLLRRPLGLYFTPEQLAEEADEYHLTAWEGNRLLGCLVLKPLDAFTIKMRQVAVTEEAQGKGIGRMLVAWSERFAQEHLFKEMVLHARDTAIPFYEHLGYTVFGEGFTEVSVPHRKMRKEL